MFYMHNLYDFQNFNKIIIFVTNIHKLIRFEMLSIYNIIYRTYVIFDEVVVLVFKSNFY